MSNIPGTNIPETKKEEEHRGAFETARTYIINADNNHVRDLLDKLVIDRRINKIEGDELFINFGNRFKVK